MKWTNMKNLQLGFHLSLRSGENGFRISMSDSFFYIYFSFLMAVSIFVTS